MCFVKVANGDRRKSLQLSRLIEKLRHAQIPYSRAHTLGYISVDLRCTLAHTPGILIPWSFIMEAFWDAEHDFVCVDNRVKKGQSW